MGNQGSLYHFCSVSINYKLFQNKFWELPILGCSVTQGPILTLGYFAILVWVFRHSHLVVVGGAGQFGNMSHGLKPLPDPGTYLSSGGQH
jgi:hypothetical protein